MSMTDILGVILAFLLCVLTGYAIGTLILGPNKLQWGHRKKDEYDGVLIINDSPEKQSWDINMNTELDKLCKKKYIVLEVRYHRTSKYSDNTEFIKNWDPMEEDE